MSKPKRIWVNLRKPTNKLNEKFDERKEYPSADKPVGGWTEYILKETPEKKND